MCFLQDKKALIIGLANHHSIAGGVAKAFHREGAELAFTAENEKLMGRVEKHAAELDSEIVIPCDVSMDTETSWITSTVTASTPLMI